MPVERTESLAAVLRAIRGHHGITQPMLIERVGWGRSVVAARISELEGAGLTGAVHLVVDELFASHRLARWLSHATPAGRPDLAAEATT